MSSPVITLTTDFGPADNYVGALKGAILSVAPDARIVDISHGVAPQDIAHGVYLTSTSWPHFPNNAIHVAVVDPGVGTDRKAILVQGPNGIFIGPDNGVLSAALPSAQRPIEDSAVAVPRGYSAVELSEPAFFNSRVSSTFHGRDIFGPVAGHVVGGVDPNRFGPRLAHIHALPFTSARSEPDGIHGRVAHIDTYGNVITDIPESMLPSRTLILHHRGHDVRGLGRTYGESEGIFALVTSDGWLAVAVPNASAQQQLGASRGDEIVVSF